MDRLKHLVTLNKPVFSLSRSSLAIGRFIVPSTPAASVVERLAGQADHPFCDMPSSLRLLETLAGCMMQGEPVLLTGETGTGKTFTVQQLADFVGRKLVVHNLNQQSDAGELVGGYKPVEPAVLAAPLVDGVKDLLCAVVSATKNKAFLDKLDESVRLRRWSAMCRMLDQALDLARGKLCGEGGAGREKRQKVDDSDASHSELLKRVERLREQLRKLQRCLKSDRGTETMAFEYVEGALVRALTVRPLPFVLPSSPLHSTPLL